MCYMWHAGDMTTLNKNKNEFPIMDSKTECIGMFLLPSAQECVFCRSEDHLFTLGICVKNVHVIMPASLRA